MNTVADALKTPGLERLDARLLLGRVTGLSHAQMVARPERELSAAEAEAFAALAARRRAGEPVAFLLGVREFYGLDFRVTPATLIPRPETELLVEFALEHLPPGGTMLDLGTGSGAIAVTVAKLRPDARVLAFDVSAEALAVASDNAARLGAGNCAFRRSDWYAALEDDARFDLIVSNPPYIAAGDVHLERGDLRFEPAGALTDFADGLSCLRIIAAGAGRYLNHGGWLACEHGYDQGPACRGLFATAGLHAVATLPDLAGLDRVTIGRWETDCGAAAGMDAAG